MLEYTQGMVVHVQGMVVYVQGMPENDTNDTG
jgi:hypothetical protein